MSFKRGTSTGVVILGSLFCLLLVNVGFTQAKRGCTAFGHSCFGGHGKRSYGGELVPLGPSPFISVGQLGPHQGQLLAEQTPEDDNAPALPMAPAYTNSRTLIGRPIINLSPLIKQWLQTYRRSSGDADAEKK